MPTPQALPRRAFLKHASALAAGGVAVAQFVPAGALAAPGRPGANDRIGIGHIGVGRRGLQIHGPKEVDTVALCDLNKNRLADVAEKWKVEATYADYRKMLDSKDVDAVVIATPDHWHALPFVHACQAGKDVYCEKPLSLTVREGRMMLAAARKYKRVCQTGSQQRSYAPNSVGCELLRSGKFGKVKKIIGMNFPSPWICGLPAQPTPAGLDWDAWCGQTEPRPYHADIYPCRANPGWLSFRRYSGGEMTGWGAHGLDTIQWAMGMDKSGPVEVWAEGGKLDPPTYTAPASLDAGNEACSKNRRVFYRYANGVDVVLDNGSGSGGTFVTDKGKVMVHRNSLKTDPLDLLEEAGAKEMIKERSGLHHWRNWIDCMKSRQTPVADVEIGHRSATVCHICNIARWTGRKLQWDPAKEVFVGDDEANSYLQRDMRKPYRLPETI